MPVRDTGYAGLKDRHAVTEQWFSVRRSIREPTSWDDFRADGVEILDRQVHNRKLKRGAHAGNSFRIAVQGADAAESADIDARLERVAAEGVPNYFGEQRFGHHGSNIELGRAVLNGCRVSRHKRGIAARLLPLQEKDGSWWDYQLMNFHKAYGTGYVLTTLARCRP